MEILDVLRASSEFAGETPGFVLKPTDSIATTLDEEFATVFLRGRTDVFARWWRSGDGRSNYSPVCANQWDRELLATAVE